MPMTYPETWASPVTTSRMAHEVGGYSGIVGWAQQPGMDHAGGHHQDRGRAEQALPHGLGVHARALDDQFPAEELVVGQGLRGAEDQAAASGPSRIMLMVCRWKTSVLPDAGGGDDHVSVMVGPVDGAGPAVKHRGAA